MSDPEDVHFAGQFLSDVLRHAPAYILPTFQRPYCWERSDQDALIDSIIRGLPIGQIVLWEQWPGSLLVDGQQRLTTLLRLATRPGIWIGLDDKHVYRTDAPDRIPLPIVMDQGIKFYAWIRARDGAGAEQADEIISTFRGARLGVCVVRGGESFVHEVYRRMNSTGVPVDLSEIRAPDDGLTLGELV